MIYKQLVRSTGDSLNLKLTPELEGSLMGLSPYLCNLMLSLGRQESELSETVGHPTDVDGVRELLGGVEGKTAHIGTGCRMLGYYNNIP